MKNNLIKNALTIHGIVNGFKYGVKSEFEKGGKIKNTSKFKIYELYDGGEHGHRVATFSNIKEAKKFYEKYLEKDGEVIPYHIDYCVKLVSASNDIFEIDEEIECQTLYNEGVIDRTNYKGENRMYYSYIATWDSKKRDLKFIMQSETDPNDKEVVYESELKNWYLKK